MGSSDFAALARALDPPLWVVTAQSGARRGGLVATFVMSASIVDELPRVLAGIAKRHHTWKLIEAAGAFALHLLDAEHLDWALRFGLESGRDADKLDGLNYRSGQTGSPILEGAIGWAECQVEERLDVGDRTVYLAEVVDAHWSSSQPPLTLHRWLPTLSPEHRSALGEHRSRDAAGDAEAIRAWRIARSIE